MKGLIVLMMAVVQFLNVHPTNGQESPDEEGCRAAGAEVSAICESCESLQLGVTQERCCSSVKYYELCRKISTVLNSSVKNKPVVYEAELARVHNSVDVEMDKTDDFSGNENSKYQKLHNILPKQELYSTVERTTMAPPSTDNDLFMDIAFGDYLNSKSKTKNYSILNGDYLYKRVAPFLGKRTASDVEQLQSLADLSANKRWGFQTDKKGNSGALHAKNEKSRSSFRKTQFFLGKRNHSSSAKKEDG